MTKDEYLNMEALMGADEQALYDSQAPSPVPDPVSITQRKTDSLSKARDSKLQKLSGLKEVNLLKMTDVDSPMFEGVTGGYGKGNDARGEVTEDRLLGFDSYEVYPEEGMDSGYFSTDNGIEKLDRQRTRLAGEMGVPVDSVTNEDVFQKGAEGALKEYYLASAYASGNEDNIEHARNWQPTKEQTKYWRDNKLILGTDERPLNIPMERATTGEYGYFGRPLSVARPMDSEYLLGQEGAGYEIDDQTVSMLKEAISPVDEDFDEVKAVRDVLLQRESSGDYTKPNSLGYLGGYQFGASALVNVGYVDQQVLKDYPVNSDDKDTKNAQRKARNLALKDPKYWTGKDEVSSMEAYLGSPDVQDNAFNKLAESNLKELARLGVIDDETSSEDLAGLIAASHLGGVGGATKMYKEGVNAKDAYGTGVSEYFNLGKSALTSTSTPSSSTGEIDLNTATDAEARAYFKKQSTDKLRASRGAFGNALAEFQQTVSGGGAGVGQGTVKLADALQEGATYPIQVLYNAVTDENVDIDLFDDKVKAMMIKGIQDVVGYDQGLDAASNKKVIALIEKSGTKLLSPSTWHKILTTEEGRAALIEYATNPSITANSLAEIVGSGVVLGAGTKVVAKVGMKLAPKVTAYVSKFTASNSQVVNQQLRKAALLPDAEKAISRAAIKKSYTLGKRIPDLMKGTVYTNADMAIRMNEDITQYQKNNGGEGPTPEKLMQILTLNRIASSAEIGSLKMGIKVSKKTVAGLKSGVENAIKVFAKHVVKTTGVESVQETFDGIVQQINQKLDSKDYEGKTLKYILDETSSEIIGGTIAGGAMGTHIGSATMAGAAAQSGTSGPSGTAEEEEEEDKLTIAKAALSTRSEKPLSPRAQKAYADISGDEVAKSEAIAALRGKIASPTGLLGSDRESIESLREVKDTVETLVEDGQLSAKEIQGIKEAIAKDSPLGIEDIASEVDRAVARGEAVQTLRKTAETVSGEVADGPRGFLTYYNDYKISTLEGDSAKQEDAINKLATFLDSQETKLSDIQAKEQQVLSSVRDKVMLTAAGIKGSELTKVEFNQALKAAYEEYASSKEVVRTKYGAGSKYKFNIKIATVLEKHLGELGIIPKAGNIDTAGVYGLISSIADETSAMRTIMNDMVDGVIDEPTAAPVVNEPKTDVVESYRAEKGNKADKLDARVRSHGSYDAYLGVLRKSTNPKSIAFIPYVEGLKAKDELGLTVETSTKESEFYTVGDTKKAIEVTRKNAVKAAKTIADIQLREDDTREAKQVVANLLKDFGDKKLIPTDEGNMDVGSYADKLVADSKKQEKTDTQPEEDTGFTPDSDYNPTPDMDLPPSDFDAAMSDMRADEEDFVPDADNVSTEGKPEPKEGVVDLGTKETNAKVMETLQDIQKDNEQLDLLEEGSAEYTALEKVIEGRRAELEEFTSKAAMFKSFSTRMKPYVEARADAGDKGIGMVATVDEENARKANPSVLFTIGKLTGLNWSDFKTGELKARVTEAVDILKSTILPANMDDKTGTVKFNDANGDMGRLFLFELDGSINRTTAAAIEIATKEAVVNNFEGLLSANTMESLGERFPGADENYLFSTLVSHPRGGMLQAELADSIGSLIMSTLGISKLDSASALDTKALTTSLGAYGVALLTEQGYIENSRDPTTALGTYDSKTGEAKGNKERIHISTGTSKLMDEYKDISNQAKADHETFALDTDMPSDYLVEKPVVTKSKSIRRHKYTQISNLQVKALNKAEGAEFKVNSGASVIKELFADAKSLLDHILPPVGKDRSFDAQEKYRAQKIAAEKAVDSFLEVSADDGPTSMWFKWFIAKNHRLHLDSAGFNPQNEKQLARWLATTTSSRYETSVDDIEGYLGGNENLGSAGFVYGVVQGFDDAIDTSVDKNPEKEVKRVFEELVNKTDAELIELLKKSSHVGHAALAVANIRKYKEGGEFTSDIIFESDGLTNGFAFRTLQFPDSANAQWLTKTGFIADGTNEFTGLDSMNAFKSLDAENTDVYETAGAKVKLTSKHTLETILNDNKLVNDKIRSLMKYPVMIINYGSSLTSIEKNITKDKVEDVAEVLLTREGGKADGAYVVTDGELKTIDSRLPGLRAKLLVASIHSPELAPLKGILEEYVGDKYAGPITDYLGEVFEEQIRYNGIMNNAFNGVYNALAMAYEKFLEDAGGNATEAEATEFLKDNLKFSPLVTTSSSDKLSEGILMIKKQLDKDVKSKVRTKFVHVDGLDGSQGNKPYIRTIKNPGVMGVVMMVLGMDGTTMAKTLNDSAEGFLSVHDAIVLGAGEMQSIVDYNRNFYEGNRDYSMVGVILDMLKRVEGDKEFTGNIVAGFGKDAVGFDQVLADVEGAEMEIARIREEIFDKDAKVGQMVGPNGTMSIHNQKVDTDMEAKVLAYLQSGVGSRPSIQSRIAKILKDKGCTK